MNQLASVAHHWGLCPRNSSYGSWTRTSVLFCIRVKPQLSGLLVTRQKAHPKASVVRACLVLSFFVLSSAYPVIQHQLFASSQARQSLNQEIFVEFESHVKLLKSSVLALVLRPLTRERLSFPLSFAECHAVC